MRTVRILLRPLLAARAPAGQQVFDGAVLALERRGSGTSQAGVGSPTDAKITLEMRFSDRVRAPGDTMTQILATLEGKLVFSDAREPSFEAKVDDDGEPVGLVPDPGADPNATDDDDDQDDDENAKQSRRVMRFRFETPDFTGVPEDGNELTVELDAERFAYMEIHAKLDTGGAEEASFDADDVLDVFITTENPPPLTRDVFVGLHPPLADEIPSSASVTFTPSTGAAVTVPLCDGVDLGDGLLYFRIQKPKPGVLYAAQVDLGDGSELPPLFEGVELHQLVVSPDAASLALPALGSDGLVFASAPPEVVDDDAVEGGPLETTDEQLAEFTAAAPETAVA
ncbi:MAG TPA: hypothetical protein VHU80_06815 [Polyangiaceae bacterium]|nr:hypothetical protein [Polyangiaceae bacterium]